MNLSKRISKPVDKIHDLQLFEIVLGTIVAFFPMQ